MKRTNRNARYSKWTNSNITYILSMSYQSAFSQQLCLVNLLIIMMITIKIGRICKCICSYVNIKTILKSKYIFICSYFEDFERITVGMNTLKSLKREKIGIFLRPQLLNLIYPSILMILL